MIPIKQGDAFLPRLPNVGGFQAIQAAHINALSKGIGKYAVNNVVGGTLKRGERGSTIIVSPPFEESHPFQVNANDQGIFVREGNVFSPYDGFAASPDDQHGTPVQCAVANSQYEVEEPFGFWWWPHPEEMKKGDSYKVSISIGNGPAILRYDQFSESHAEWAQQMGLSEYPIAWVTQMDDEKKSFMIEQILTTNIFSYTRSHAWKLSAFTLPTYEEDEEGNTINGPSEVRIKVALGFVNGVRPTYVGGGLVGDGYSSVSYGTGTGTEKYVYLKIKAEPKPSNMPVTAEVNIGTTIPSPTNEYAYLGLGMVNVLSATGKPSDNIKHVIIQQAAQHSVHVSAHRFVPNIVEYFFGAI